MQSSEEMVRTKDEGKGRRLKVDGNWVEKRQGVYK